MIKYFCKNNKLSVKLDIIQYQIVANNEYIIQKTKIHIKQIPRSEN